LWDFFRRLKIFKDVKNEEAVQGAWGTESPCGVQGRSSGGGVDRNPPRSWKAFKIHLAETLVLWYTVAYLRGDHSAMFPLWPDHENFLQATLYQKVRFIAIFQQKLQNSTMFDGLFSYRYSMRLKSPCEIASDMTRRRRRALWKPAASRIGL